GGVRGGGMGWGGGGLGAWTALAWVLMLICFFLLPPPNPDPGLTPVNVNYVWGMSDTAAQTWVSPAVWLAGMMIGLPLVLCAPVHFLLKRFMPQAAPSASYAA